MAVHNPTDLYGGWGGDWNPTPYVQFAIRQKQMRDAKAEAVDNYFRDMTKGLSPTGMRAQDVPDYIQKKNNFQNFVIQNKAALRNPALDNGKARIQANYLFNDAQEHVARSVDEGKNMLSVQKLLMNPEIRDRLDDDTLAAMQQGNLALSNPNHKTMDLSTIGYKAKPFDLAMQQNYLKGASQGLSMGQLTPEITTDPKTMTQTVKIKSTYGKDALDAIANRASGVYSGDKSAREFANTALSTQQAHDELNPIFKSTYGRDIETPQDALAAWTLSGIQKEKDNQKVQDDKAALEAMRQANRLKLEGYKQGNRMALLAKKRQFQKENKADQEGILKGYMGDLEDRARQGGVYKYKLANGKEESRYKLDNTPELREIFSYKNADNGRTIYPDDFRLLENGDYQPIFFNKDDKGNIIKGASGLASVDESRSKPVSNKTVKFNLGKEMLSTKQRYAEMQEDNNDEGDESTNETVVETPKKTTVIKKTTTTPKKKDTLGIL